jgi:aspartyl-tRNA(Asn)/glutamyl-tRNA(Gln) amidotransferase subunit A
MDLTQLSLHEAALGVRTGRLSPIVLAEAYLDRIARQDGVLRAYITITSDLVLRQARAAAKALQRGEYAGPLQGVPLALKDVFETAGVRTTAGSKFLAAHVPATDSVVAAKLTAAGAVMLRKLNMHRWALGVSNDNPFCGACLNPWNLAHIPGGSSGGSAAGPCLGALGSDTAGSISIPAALCGGAG